MATREFSLLPPPASVPLHTFVLSGLKMLWMSLVTENPLTWDRVQGRSHPRADVTGPFYVIGAPNVNFAPGKAVLGAAEDLKSSPLFLFSGKILGPNGEPVAATLDLWQANTSGMYALTSYRNRGKVSTDPATGKFEVLTVPPAQYGISASVMRAAHIHAIISAPGYQPIVTQFYLASRNDPTPLKKDWQVLIQRPGWAVPTDKGDLFWDLPQLKDSDTEGVKLVAEWNGYLQNHGLKISCGASDIIKLNKA
ncbi:intradiol ring-cleavage dioxygenase [Ceratobasidium sp. AG-Ba]|nr:intradiol ring-cleavage dioxygenase [Ceratobasidium sp. AG-Ba]